MLFLKSQPSPFALFTGKDKLFHALQVVTVKALPPSVSRLYLGDVRLKLQYLVCKRMRSWKRSSEASLKRMRSWSSESEESNALLMKLNSI